MDPKKMAEKTLRIAAKRGVTKAKLSRIAGVAPARINEWAADDWHPDVGQALAMARALGVNLEWLADDELDESRQPITLSGEDERVVEFYRLAVLANRGTQAFMALMKLAEAATPGVTGVDVDVPRPPGKARKRKGDGRAS